jgi:outer membrane protein OmpA-like peptidoglycan-associated protein
VPDDETRTALVQLAKGLFSGQRVVDEMIVVHGGSSARWRRVAEDALKMLARLRVGSALIEDEQLMLSGEARDTVAQAAVRDMLATTLPKGYRGRETLEVRADSALWSEAEARKKAEADLRRQADEEARKRAQADAAARTEADVRKKADEEARLRAAAEEAKRKSDAEVRAKAEAAAKADADARKKAEEQTRLRAAAEEAKRKSDADARAKADAAARVEAETRKKAEEQARLRAAADEAKRKSDAEAVARAEAETRKKAEPSPKAKAEADTCQTLLRSAAATGVIRFQRASAVIERDSFSTLDALASIVSKCPQALIQVEGHTDSDGTPERNQLLSERRAGSVAEYLIRAGVSQTRLTAVGVGETRPVAPNDTVENKARNRRIEFTVRAQ